MGMTKQNKVLARLREPSTWAGVAAIAALFGVPAEQVSTVAQAVAGVAGVVAMVLPEGKRADGGQ